MPACYVYDFGFDSSALGLIHFASCQVARGAKPEDNFRQWQQTSLNLRNKMNVSPTFAPWTSRASFTGAGVNLTPRVKDLMDCVAASMMRAGNLSMAQLPEKLKDTILDVSQSHSRKAFTFEGTHKCLTTSSTLYSYRLDRCILPLETLWWQGYPRCLKIPPGMSAADVKDFAGEGMSLPCLATCLFALIWNVKMGQPHTAP